MATWSIRSVVEWAASDFGGRGIESPRLDAELLVSEALSMDRVRLYMDLDRPLGPGELETIRALVKRRRLREPMAYILGRREFFGRTFDVGPGVLVPRPDTETLVERALELLAEDTDARVLDLCTGSGAIGVTLALERPRARVEATDRSEAALAIAARNAERLGVEIGLLAGDLFEPVCGRYALIACNPPYVAECEVDALAPELRDHEPRAALVAGPTGFEIHDRVIAGAGEHLEAGGVLLIEVGMGQAQELERRLRAQPWVASTAMHEDLGRVQRVVEAATR